MTIDIKVLEKPHLSEPILICGLPGSGYVGKLAAEHLINELEASLIGEVYSSSFPPQVTIRPNGTSGPMKNVIYASKGNNSIPDMLIFTGDSQPITPEANYTLSDRIVDLAEELGVKKVFTLAAYITGAFVKVPRVFGTATQLDLVKELENNGVTKMNEGMITGMNGVLIGVAKIRGLTGASLLGETSGYIIDAKASQAVLEILNSVLRISVDLTDLENKAKEAESVIQTIEQMKKKSQGGTAWKSEIPESRRGYIS